MQNRQLIFSPKIQYELAAEPRTRASSVRGKLREAASNSLWFSKMWTYGESNPNLIHAMDS